MTNRLLLRLVPCVVLVFTLGCSKAAEIVPAILPAEVQIIQEPSPPIVLEKDSILDLERPETLTERFSYTYGYLLYNTLLYQEGFDDLDVHYFARGAFDAAHANGFFSHDEMTRTINEVQIQLLQIAQQEVEALSVANLADAEIYLEHNARNEGIASTDSGLQYEVIEAGGGSSPTAESIVEIDYRLFLVNGRLIDSSYDREGRAIFRLADIGVQGFLEGVLLMQEGGHYRFWIHPSLAWGKEGNQLVEPNTLLVLEVELYAVR